MIGSILSVILTALPLTVIPSEGAFLRQLQPRDSILIADQLLYGFDLKGVEEGTMLFFPELRNEENQTGPMLLGTWQIDTLKVYRPKKGRPASYDLRAGIVITSFDEGEYQLPPLAAMRQTAAGAVDTLVFEPMTMTVTTLAVDTENFELNDIKGQIRYPVTFREILPYLIGFWALATIVILIVCLVMMRKRMADQAFAHRDPAHIVALRKLDHYRGDKFWNPDKQKVFYSGVTDALREYIVARYGVAAMEMTTGEIFDGLKDTDMPKDLYRELEDLFRRADFVKFAKYVADRDENAAVLPLAVRFVTTTYQAEVEEDSAEGEGKAPEGGASDGQASGGAAGSAQQSAQATGQASDGASEVVADGAQASDGAAEDRHSEIPAEHSKWIPQSEERDDSKWYPKG